MPAPGQTPRSIYDWWHQFTAPVESAVGVEAEARKADSEARKAYQDYLSKNPNATDAQKKPYLDAIQSTLQALQDAQTKVGNAASIPGKDVMPVINDTVSIPGIRRPPAPYPYSGRTTYNTTTMVNGVPISQTPTAPPFQIPGGINAP